MPNQKMRSTQRKCCVFGRPSLALLLLLLSGRAFAQAAAESDGEELRWLQRAATRHAHLDEPSRRSLETRLRLAPLLPQLRLSAGRGWQWGTYTYNNGDGSTASLRDAQQLNYAATAHWELSRLLFAREEVTLRREAQHEAQERTRLHLRVARLYGQRCRAQLEQADAKSSEARHKLAERTATLDLALAALTGDEFVGRKLRRCQTAVSTTWASEIDSLLSSSHRAPPLAGDGAEDGDFSPSPMEP